MSRTDCDIRIGTSGWYYDHWIERFYPEGLPKSKWLDYYAGHFNTVEINNTFYHQPKETTMKKWHEQAPKGFLYAVKANRYITHIKRLKDAGEPLGRFLKSAALLKEKLGPVLYQLPPGLHKNPELLRSFLELLPGKPSSVFEFRHKSWFSDDIYGILEKAGVGFCIHDMPGNESPRSVVSDIIYIRFHGPTDRYSGSYSKAVLQNWADWIKKHKKQVKGIYVYFNNDADANAVFNAKTLKELLRTL